MTVYKLTKTKNRQKTTFECVCNIMFTVELGGNS